jgi:outer membrane protein TolC
MTLAALLAFTSLAGCSWLDRTSTHPQALTPERWQSAEVRTDPPSDAWLSELGYAALPELARRAESGNHTLQEQAAVVSEAQAAVRVVAADRWPAIELILDTAERQSGVDF